MVSKHEIRPATIDPVSYCSLPIRLNVLETQTTLATATGFLYKSGGSYFLITNWHNLTGVNPETRKRLGLFATSPTSIELPLLDQTKPYIKWKRVFASLYDSAQRPKWLIHPIHKEVVDVVALELGTADKGSPIKALNECDFDDIKPRVADEVFILGFPHSLNSGGNFPLWKRGSIASEPDVDLDKLPKMLVDTASRPGMSGSPVIYRRQGIHGLVKGAATDETLIGEIQNFCGVYSGRINTKTELDSRLGVVWKASVIKEIIDGGQKDNKHYPTESFA